MLSLHTTTMRPTTKPTDHHIDLAPPFNMRYFGLLSNTQDTIMIMMHLRSTDSTKWQCFSTAEPWQTPPIYTYAQVNYKPVDLLLFNKCYSRAPLHPTVCPTSTTHLHHLQHSPTKCLHQHHTTNLIDINQLILLLSTEKSLPAMPAGKSSCLLLSLCLLNSCRIAQQQPTAPLRQQW